ncbi:uncharacterized protein LOC130630365 [Hydractinia symbiolongicarpus]|uniref:uncharacterized protein LOC130630365 n=1 Tax=Hydractinia symbiolongicarpus TaxID=13093 RepID=UPI00254AC574|nr:uncharacterized protein LOC130630365 [Hydractinia symbiolongicarpus]
MNKNKRKFNDSNRGSKRFCQNFGHEQRNPKDIIIPTKKSIFAGSSRGGHSRGNDSSRSLDAYMPQGVNVYDYAESRALEMKNLKRALTEAKFSQDMRAFQQLPRHMRRRAASHDVKRLPKYLRNRALKEMDEPASKKKSRKFKRRPKNLVEEYTRRSKNHFWLETHIWHAKRFKMVEKWGYKIAQQPCDKSFRATYRAATQTCLLQDKSFMEFIEFAGSEEHIIEVLKQMCPPGAEKLLTTEKVLSGSCYEEIILYQCNQHPYKAVGPVKFIWTSNNTDAVKRLVLISHPSISSEVLHEVRSISSDRITIGVIVDVKMEDDGSVNTSQQTEINNCMQTPENNLDVKPNQTHILKNVSNYNKNDTQALENVPYVKANCTQTEQKEKLPHIFVTKRVLDFVVFSLTGPISHKILNNVFTFPNQSDDSTHNKHSNKLWESLSTDEVCAQHNSIFNLIVEDPRFHIPYKKKNPHKLPTHLAQKSTVVEHCNTPSLLWNKDNREKIKSEKKTDLEINSLRNEYLLPGSKLPISSPKIPVVVLQRPCVTVNQTSTGGGDRSYNGGLDILLPANWAMPFWVALTYQGARAGGLREEENVDLECLLPYFPNSFPDTSAGREVAKKKKKEAEDNHMRHPPNNRCNYDVLGIKNPFALPWQDLLNEWRYNLTALLPNLKDIVNYRKEDFYVLRDNAVLNDLNKFFTQESKDTDKKLLDLMLNYANCLVPVRVYALKKGCPEMNAPLCIPLQKDIEYINRSEDLDNDVGPLEPKHGGLKHLFPYICKQHEILRHNALTIGCNTRWVIGYVQDGRYSLARGKGAAIGFVSMLGLRYLVDTNTEFKLLFRNIGSFQYRFCNFEVMTSS